MLEWREVYVRLSGREILRNINVSLRRRRITVLLGRNGSGKSTLLGTVCRAVAYDGEIFCEGTSLRSLSPRERARRIAVLPQILPDSRLNVSSLIALGRTPYVGGMGILSEEDREAVREATERMELCPFSERIVSSLSGGERQRVFIAMMLAQGAECLLFDEPTTYMDIPSRRELYTICRSLRADGKTLLLTMHDINEALLIADDIVLLDGGEVVFCGTREEILVHEDIEHIFGVSRHLTEDGICFFC